MSDAVVLRKSSHIIMQVACLNNNRCVVAHRLKNDHHLPATCRQFQPNWLQGPSIDYLKELFNHPSSYFTYLLHQFNAGLKIHTEIHEDPIDTFLLVFFLLKNEHVVVEKLLQLLVGEVDAKLLETVELHSIQRPSNQLKLLFFYSHPFKAMPISLYFSIMNLNSIVFHNYLLG